MRQKVHDLRKYLLFFPTRLTFKGFRHGLKIIFLDFVRIPYRMILWWLHLPRRLAEGLGPLLHSHEWVLNALFVAGPLLILSLSLAIVNIVISTRTLDIWAHGNILFVLLTLYTLYQATVVVPEIFELDFILNRIKSLRIFNLAAGFMFNSVYLFFAGTYVINNGFTMAQKLDQSASTADIITDWINLGIASMLVMGAPNLILNLILMFKEAQFYLFTVSNEFVFIRGEDLQEALQLFMSLLSPLTWVELFYHQMFGYDIWDLVSENPDNETRFYLNMWQ